MSIFHSDAPILLPNMLPGVAGIDGKATELLRLKQSRDMIPKDERFLSSNYTHISRVT